MMGVGVGVVRGDRWRGITVSAVQILKPLVMVFRYTKSNNV